MDKHIIKSDFRNDDEFLTVKNSYSDYIKDLESLNQSLAINTELLSVLTRFKDRSNKVFIISIANSFERHLTKTLALIFSNHNDSSIFYHFTFKFTLSRKYHSLFSWTSNNANSFYGFWGEDFSKEFKCKLSENNTLKDGERNFLNLGNVRNKIAHEGFDCNLETGWEDIDANFKKFESALEYYNELVKFLTTKISIERD